MHALITIAATLCTLATAAPADEWSDFAKQSKSRDSDDRCKAIDLIKQHKNLRMAQALLPLLADAHPRVRYRTARALGDVEDPEAVAYLVKTGLKHADRLVRQHTCEALGLIKDESTVDAVIAALEDSDPHVRAQAADTLAWMDAEKAVPTLRLAFERDKTWEGRAAALAAVGRLSPATEEALVEKAAADKAYAVRLEAMRVAPKVSKEAGLKTFKTLINDTDWRVRVQAIESALEVRLRECVGGIIDVFLKEKGRLRLDCWLALQDLTGKELGFDPKPWKGWWDANKDSFEPLPPKGDAPAEGAVTPNGKGATRAEFFTIPIFSNRVSFILDLSGSMRDEAPAGGRKKETKLDVAKRGMARTIGAFTSDVWFNIVCLGCEKDGTYRKEQRIWKKRLAPAADAARKDADRFIHAQEARGWTNIWDAVEYAFEDEEVDTIFLYSDGGASRGVWTITGELLNALDRLNRYRKIMIFTVETPSTKPNTEDNIRLLKELASRTKGLYKLADTK